MARLSNEERIVRQIIAAHGPVIDLAANPETFIEIVRKWAFDIADIEPGTPDGGGGPTGPTSRMDGPDGGSLPGGVPKPPPPAPNPASFEGIPGIPDVMKELLKLQRQVARLEKRIGG